MKIAIVAGGTGGHLYPGLAVARALPGHEVLFVVRRGDLGRDILKKEGFAVQEISGQGLPRGLSPKLITFPFKFMRGWIEGWSLLKKVKPDWVLGMGGYLSFPVVMTAHLMGIRTLLHEQNVFPGLSNRLLSRWADSVAVSFPESAKYFKAGVWVSGLPIRPEIGQADKISALSSFGLKPDIPTFLIFGGSLGAHRLNAMAVEAWQELIEQKMKFQVIHITGANDFDRILNLYKNLPISAKVIPYCHDMADAYAASDALLCRAGASSVAELLVVERPALLVPYPHASNNHQVYNAQFLEKSGIGKVVLDQDLKPSVIAEFFSHSVTMPKVTASQGADPRGAAARIATYLSANLL